MDTEKEVVTIDKNKFVEFNRQILALFESFIPMIEDEDQKAEARFLISQIKDVTNEIEGS